MKARVESDRVQVWLNGVKTVDYVQPEHTHPAVRQLSKGTFGLQGHDVLSKMQYKSFRVRRLPDDARSGLPAPALGAWHDSLTVMQGRQFAFIDLNPQGSFSAKELTDYFYVTGINLALVKSPGKAGSLKTAKRLPLFTGIKVNAGNVANVKAGIADYIIGESTDLPSARALLGSKKIDIWSDKGRSLATEEAAALLDLAKQNGVAIEIDNIARTPSIRVLKMAKEKGCTFTFSGLMPAGNMEKSIYVVEAIKGAGLDYKDLFIPKW
ncbi:MAG: DUF1080 domain-containing protein [Lewinellaceae bacterium]|nr:DUF1080 domain-containing protein [Lewinellaceae bacterium]